MARKSDLTYEVKCINCTRVVGFSHEPCSPKQDGVWVAVFCHACFVTTNADEVATVMNHTRSIPEHGCACVTH